MPKDRWWKIEAKVLESSLPAVIGALKQDEGVILGSMTPVEGVASLPPPRVKSGHHKTGQHTRSGNIVMNCLVNGECNRDDMTAAFVGAGLSSSSVSSVLSRLRTEGLLDFNTVKVWPVTKTKKINYPRNHSQKVTFDRKIEAVKKLLADKVDFVPADELANQLAEELACQVSSARNTLTEVKNALFGEILHEKGRGYKLANTTLNEHQH